MNQQVLVEMSYFIHFFRCSKKMSTPKYYYTKLLAIYRKTWIVLGRWRWQTPGINHPNISEAINLSKASCIPSAPIIILLMKQRSNAAWPFRTLESNSENTHVMSLQKGILFYGDIWNHTTWPENWVTEFFQLFSCIQFSLCKSMHCSKVFDMYVPCIWSWPEKCGFLRTRQIFQSNPFRKHSMHGLFTYIWVV